METQIQVPCQKLTHGQLLVQKNFPQFVETFNYLVDFVTHLCGDRDISETGAVSLDRSNPEWPVIRGTATTISTGGGGGGEGAPTYESGCYACASISGTTITFGDPYYQVSGKTYAGPSSYTASAGGILALRVTATGDSPSASLAMYADLDALQEAQGDTAYITLPLYRLAVSSGAASVACDMRIIPTASMVEF